MSSVSVCVNTHVCDKAVGGFPSRNCELSCYSFEAFYIGNLISKMSVCACAHVHISVCMHECKCQNFVHKHELQ